MSKKPKVTVIAQTVFPALEDRNKCPGCGSDFLIVSTPQLITWNRVRRTVVCDNCGRTFSHIYKLIYERSEF